MSGVKFSRPIFLVGLAVLLQASFLSTKTNAQEIALDQLGQLQLTYENLQLQSNYRGLSLSAKVAAYADSGYPVHRVLEATQTQWLVQTGQKVEQAQPVVELSGSAVHHFLTEHSVRKQHLGIVKQRYENNKKLFEKQAISSQQWQEISLAYQTALLEFEHLDHFYETIVAVNPSHTTITLAAPRSGILIANSRSDVLFEVIALDAVRLKGELTNRSVTPSTIKWGHCELAVERIDAASQGFTKGWWSAALNQLDSQCQLSWGSQLSVTPEYTQSVFAVPTASVLRHEQQQYVWVKQQNSLRLTPVTIIDKSASEFYVVSDLLGANQAILTQSVGAVYGHFLGLGGE